MPRPRSSVVGLAERMHHYPRQLSGGQEQRVAIARAIVTDPAILVADEPTGDLDKTSAEEVLELMDRLNREINKTILMVTHDPRAAERARVGAALWKRASWLRIGSRVQCSRFKVGLPSPMPLNLSRTLNKVRRHGTCSFTIAQYAAA